MQNKDFYWTLYFTKNTVLNEPFNSREWPRQNFFLQHEYTVKQTSNENKEKYLLGD